jgi:glycosyltransferase involved in cell wall biosynthesis
LFRHKYKLAAPFLLYAGRKDVGKNVDILLAYFEAYKRRNTSELKLVLIGGGSIKIPDFIKSDVVDLGFVDVEDKYNAYAAATVFCQPSPNESFSIVIMESWLCKRPVLVNRSCEVTSHFAKDSNGGLSFGDYKEFAGCIDYFLSHPENADRMGVLGCQYVKDNFNWEIITNKYKDHFERVST